VPSVVIRLEEFFQKQKAEQDDIIKQHEANYQILAKGYEEKKSKGQQKDSAKEKEKNKKRSSSAGKYLYYSSFWFSFLSLVNIGFLFLFVVLLVIYIFVLAFLLPTLVPVPLPSIQDAEQVVNGVQETVSAVAASAEDLLLGQLEAVMKSRDELLEKNKEWENKLSTMKGITDLAEEKVRSVGNELMDTKNQFEEYKGTMTKLQQQAEEKFQVLVEKSAQEGAQFLTMSENVNLLESVNHQMKSQLEDAAAKLAENAKERNILNEVNTRLEEEKNGLFQKLDQTSGLFKLFLFMNAC
jgi:hypothetical protein